MQDLKDEVSASKMSGKRTVIIGATTNPSRYAYLAAERLHSNNHEIIPVGIKKGIVFNKPIQDIRERPFIPDVDTVTMYLNPTNQHEWEEYILSLKPNRIIFNPGTENPSLLKKANANNIQTTNACTLVLLSAGSY